MKGHKTSRTRPLRAEPRKSAWSQRSASNLVSRSVFLLILAGLALAACGPASASKPSSRTLRVPGAAASTSAFGRYLHHRYGSVTGYWTCPSAKAQAFPATGSRSCLGEVAAHGERHLLLGDARFSGSRVVISVDPHAVATWTMHWWPFSRQFITVGPKPWAPGTISVNSPAYDWWFLARCAHTGKTQCVGADGLAQGFSRFYLFKCAASNGLVVCQNRLGDVMRYRQHQR
jgi:hypothetical protein